MILSNEMYIFMWCNFSHGIMCFCCKVGITGDFSSLSILLILPKSSVTPLPSYKCQHLSDSTSVYDTSALKNRS